jgi:hypothetical protein
VRPPPRAHTISLFSAFFCDGAALHGPIHHKQNGVCADGAAVSGALMPPGPFFTESATASRLHGLFHGCPCAPLRLINFCYSLDFAIMPSNDNQATQDMMSQVGG